MVRGFGEQELKEMGITRTIRERRLDMNVYRI